MKWFPWFILSLIIVSIILLVCESVWRWFNPPPLPPPDRSTLRRSEVDADWEANYGHVRHEDCE
jgi:hypothetical protein